MAGWHSLSGFLYYRPGGTLGKLKVRRRLWYVFEEKNCELLFYKTQEDATRSKEPQGSIDIKGAAINLSLNDNCHQFNILSNNKEHILTADNHESMMIWLLGLQAKRDAYANRSSSSSQGSLDTMGVKEDGLGDEQMKPRGRAQPPSKAESIQLDQSLPADAFRRLSLQSEPGEKQDSLRRGSLQVRADLARHQRLLRRLGDSVDGGLDGYQDDADEMDLEMSWPRTSLHRGLEKAQSAMKPASKCNSSDGISTSGLDSTLSSQVKPALSHSQHSTDSQTSTTSSEIRIRLGSTSSNGSYNSDASYMNEDIVVGDGGRPILSRQNSRNKSRINRSESGHSMSSDSAIDHTDHSNDELASRLASVENELLATKVELAKFRNKETVYKTKKKKVPTATLC